MLITIIIPIHNSERYLKQCIESAINQTFYNIEILCIDGGSTDNSRIIVDEFCQKDCRVKAIYDENASYGHKINVGIQAAQGKYIGILESDDIMGLNMIEKLSVIAEEYDVDIVDSDFYEFFNFKEKVYKTITRKYPAQELYNRVLNCYNLVDFKGIWTALYKKKFITGNNIWLNESKGASYQDTSFMFLACHLANTIYHVNLPLYQYRIDNSGSSVKDDNKIFEIIGEYEFLKRELLKRGIHDRDKWILYYKSKYGAFYWNYRRLSSKAREAFLVKYMDEIRQDIEKNNIERNMFSKNEYSYTYRLIDDIGGFVKAVIANDKNPSIMNLLENMERRHDKEVVLFGAGVWGTKVLEILSQSNVKVCAMCDNSKLLQGSFKSGLKITSVEEATYMFPEAVYCILSRNCAEAMKKQLLKHKIIESKIIIFK